MLCRKLHTIFTIVSFNISLSVSSQVPCLVFCVISDMRLEQAQDSKVSLVVQTGVNEMNREGPQIPWERLWQEASCQNILSVPLFHFWWFPEFGPFPYVRDSWEIKYYRYNTVVYIDRTILPPPSAYPKVGTKGSSSMQCYLLTCPKSHWLLSHTHCNIQG